jgi:hypothetical protein
MGRQQVLLGDIERLAAWGQDHPELFEHPEAVYVRPCRFSATEIREFTRMVMQSMPPAPRGTTIGGYMTDYRSGKVTVILSSFNRRFGESLRNHWGADRIDIEYGTGLDWDPAHK